MGENDMKVLADALWGYFRDKYLIPYLSDSVCYFQATVTQAPVGGTIGVQRPFDNEMTLPYAWSASSLAVGQQCTVLVFGDTSNAIVIGDGSLGEPGIYVTKAGLLGSTGAATDNTMTQKAITDALDEKPDPGDIPSPSSANPAMDGTASPGSSDDYARGDHVHPTDSSRAPVSHAVNANTYGLGTSGVYGHVKLSDSTSSTSGANGGIAATPAAVKSAYDLADGKQDPLTFDAAPTSGSTNPVTSEGILTAIENATKSYMRSFNGSTEWTHYYDPTEGVYSTITFTAATHGCGTSPDVSVWRRNGTQYQKLYGYPSSGWSITVDANGDVTIKATDAFAGRVKITQ